MKIKLAALSLFLTLAFSTNPWGGVSVSTADNLDALALNPAGLAVERGNQSGFFIPTVEDGPFSIHSAGRGDGFGYSLESHLYWEVSEIINDMLEQVNVKKHIGDYYD